MSFGNQSKRRKTIEISYFIRSEFWGKMKPSYFSGVSERVATDAKQSGDSTHCEKLKNCQTQRMMYPCLSEQGSCLGE